MKKLLIALITLLLVSTFVYAADPVSMKERNSIIPGFHYAESIASGETGRNIQIPPIGLNGTNLTVTIIAGANTGKFQFTTSSDTLVQADRAIWVDWTEGTVTGSLSMALVTQVTGIRGVSVSGKIKIELVY